MITRCFLLLVAAVVWCTQLHADDHVAPQPMTKDSPEAGADLVVKGAIGRSPALFSLEALMQRPPVTIVQKSTLTGKTNRYTGASMIDVLTSLNLQPNASVVEVIAANDYKATIKLSDLKRYTYVLSYKMDGKLYKDQPLRFNKGPLAIAIDFINHPELDFDIYKHQQVWFVKTIIVR